MNGVQEVQTPKNIPRDNKVHNLPVDMIHPNPYQPRKYFEPMALVDLAQSIRQYGLMQPISVRAVEYGKYELVAGERRLRASKLAELKEIPALIVDITDTDSAALAMVENLLRQDLNYIEEAEGFALLLDNHGMTQEDLANRLGKNQSTIANKLRLLKLPRSVKRALVYKNLSERHARALLKIQKDVTEDKAEEVMLSVVEKVVAEELTVQKTEELIKQILSGKESKSKSKTAPKMKLHIKDLRIFTNTVKHAIGIMQDSGLNTDYQVEEHEDGCTITVKVTY
ncbi:MAG: ParB/RepB/Spo0J family partition protein [Defluviitaleaceae bacterium]|nr:ParB/RepB/Spo0J family partition protein [Defluviitaleaceae bacterium]